mgnify:CR=1 FL=1
MPLEDTFVSNIALKEVGTATGWTEADQELDIPQTALQSYNQLAWFNDNEGEDNPHAYASHHNDFNPEAGDFTVSAWVMQSDTLDDNYFFAKGSGGASGWHCRVEIDGTIQFTVEDNDGANDGTAFSNNINAADFDVAPARPGLLPVPLHPRAPDRDLPLARRRR